MTRCISTGTVKEIEKIENRYNQVLIPKDPKRRPKVKKNPTIVAIDIEDYGVARVTKDGKGEDFHYNERLPLAITIAYQRQDAIIRKYGVKMDCKWTYEKILNWILHVLTRIFHVPLPRDKTLYVISHFSTAELRHVKDWNRINPHHIFVGKGDFIHVRTKIGKWKLKIIDSFAFFWKGLGAIAEFGGMEKIKIEYKGKGDDYWKSHMNELWSRNRHLFWRYAVNDSVILIKAWHRWRQYFLEEFNYEILNDRTPTIASIAADIFRMDYLDRPAAPHHIVQETGMKRYRNTNKYRRVKKGRKKTIYLGDRDVRYAAMRAYWGGRREAFGRGVKRETIAVLDFKGHYNRCGQTQPLPNQKTKWHKWGYLPDDPISDWNLLDGATESAILKCEGFVTCDFEFSKGFQYPCLPVKNERSNRLIFPIKSERAAFTIFEMKIALSLDPELKLKNLRICGFLPTNHETNHPLRRFLAAMEGRKNEAQNLYGKKSLQYHASKLIGNAMVGKFLQKVDDWSFEDTLDLYGCFDYDRDRLSSFLSHKRKSGKIVGSTWAPEWGALILGRARGLLGLCFHITKALTGHTDSMVFEYDKEKTLAVFMAMRQYDARLAFELFCDTFWILRSAVYVYFKNGKPIKAVHHGYPCKHEDFGELIRKNLEAGAVVEDKVRKVSIVKPRSAMKRNLPLGADFLRETQITWKWDYKRKRKNPDADLWSGWTDTEPWETAEDAWDLETVYLHKRDGIVIRERPGRVGKIDRKRVFDLRKKGLSQREIAKELGVSQPAIWKILHKR